MSSTCQVCILGLGYIGLPTAVMLAKAGHQVIGVDINQERLSALNHGFVPIDEPLLDEYFKEQRLLGRLTFASQPAPSDTFLIAVPTPVNPDFTADLAYLNSALDSLLPVLQKGNLIIIESTIPPTTTDEFVGSRLAKSGWKVGEEIFLAHCPERVIPGNIIEEIIHNPRIVGGINLASTAKAIELYRSFVKGKLMQTTAINAEMSKLMENTFRDVNIALANELAKMSAIIGVNALDIIDLANHHPRVNILQPGPGVGGHCIPVDPYFIIERAFQYTPLMQTARQINNSMPEFVANQVERLAPVSSQRRISVFGIAYKGNVDDFRESPALEIIRLLKQKGYEVRAHDPRVSGERSPVPLVSWEESLTDSSLLLILADHDEFRNMDPKRISRLMKQPLIFDTKNCILLPDPAVKLVNFNNLFNNVQWEDDRSIGETDGQDALVS